jgi:ABC-2 type transport system ATP-binding protein
MPDELSSRDLYVTAAEYGVQIRRIQLRRDSLEDIFLRAMDYEGGRVDHVSL